jgi:hypothetical protein
MEKVETGCVTSSCLAQSAGNDSSSIHRLVLPMSEPIKVGDLVMVVRWPHDCINPKGVPGTPFRVTDVIRRKVDYCAKCKVTIPTMSPHSAVGFDGRASMPTDWLKRIDPNEELDDVKRDEEITA